MNEEINNFKLVDSVFMCIENQELKSMGSYSEGILDYLYAKKDFEALNNVVEVLSLTKNLSYDMLYIDLAQLGIYRLPKSLAGLKVSTSTDVNIRAIASELVRED